MSNSTDSAGGGPQPGMPEDEYEQAQRDAVAMLEDDLETPRSFFLAMHYGNGTDYIHAHTAETDGDVDGKVYDLFVPLALHLNEVAETAEADIETVVECAVEMAETIEAPEPGA